MLIHIEKNGLSSLLEHPVVPPIGIIQRVEISREIITNCLNYKISHLLMSQKSLSNIIYNYTNTISPRFSISSHVYI